MVQLLVSSTNITFFYFSDPTIITYNLPSNQQTNSQARNRSASPD